MNSATARLPSAETPPRTRPARCNRATLCSSARRCSHRCRDTDRQSHQGGARRRARRSDHSHRTQALTLPETCHRLRTRKLAVTTRGRPLGTVKAHLGDLDGRAVALLEAQMVYAPLRGVRVPERSGAPGGSGSARIPGGSRLSTRPPPFPRWPRPGVEIHPEPRRCPRDMERSSCSIAPIEVPQDRCMSCAADRIRKKRKVWRSRKESWEWLRVASLELACYLYPEMAHACRVYDQGHPEPN